MKTINTDKFGKIEYEENNVINFPDGIFGVYDKKKFIHLNTGHDNFSWILCIEDIKLSILATEPYWFMPDYNKYLKKNFLLISIFPERYTVLNGVFFDRSNRKVYANMIAPFVIEKKNKTGFQILLTETELSHQFDVIEAFKKINNPENCGV